MSLISTLLSLENPVFCGYITYNSVLILKMMIMSPLTGGQRLKQSCRASPEEGKDSDDSLNEDIERVRRAHLNDLENIPIYFLAGLAYVLTDPNPTVAINLFRVYTVARCLHTFVYAIYEIRQPARAICWGVGFLITGYMAIQAIVDFKTF